MEAVLLPPQGTLILLALSLLLPDIVSSRVVLVDGLHRMAFVYEGLPTNDSKISFM